MNAMMEMNKKAEALFNAYNDKIGELRGEISLLEKTLPLDELEYSIEYALLCAMQDGLITARDRDWEQHAAIMRDMAPEHDGD